VVIIKKYFVSFSKGFDVQFRFYIFIYNYQISFIVFELRAKIVDEIDDQCCPCDRRDILLIEDSKLFYVIEDLLNFRVERRFEFCFGIYLANSIQTSNGNALRRVQS
jgi:hypothetical protein